MDWPVYYKNILRVSNLNYSVGIATMWTERDYVTKVLHGLEDKYCVVGNLYGQAGITAIIRNVFAKPSIRIIILWGADLSASGQSLLYFMDNGIDENYQIIGDPKKGMIEKDIDRKSLKLFRKKVKVINLRGKPASELVSTVKKYSVSNEKPFSKPKIFPTTKTVPATFPSEQIGFRIEARTVAQTWLKVLNNIMRYGRPKRTRYTQNNELKELLNLVAVVNDEDPDNIYFPHYLPFSKKELEEYYPQVLTAREIPGIAYTYGQRLRKNQGVDQIAEMIKLLKKRPFSKKMAAFTANVRMDWNNVNKGDTPCLTMILGSIQDNRFILTTHFRSQDMVHGWPRNVFSLRKLQKYIAEKGGFKMGQFVMITHSAHIYSDDYELVEKILEENYINELGYSSSAHFAYDPRGNVVISVEENEDGKKEIVAKLYAPDGGLQLAEWRGEKAYEVYVQMTDWDYLIMPSHLIYIGTELQRAEYAIEKGMSYHQDPAAGEQLKRMKKSVGGKK